MVIAVQVILLIVLLSSFEGEITGKDKSSQGDMLTVFLVSLAAFTVSMFWL